MRRLAFQLLVLAMLVTSSADAAVVEPFRIGVYVYENQLAAAAADEGREYVAFVEHHLRILRDHGVNALYLGATTPERFDDHLRLAERYGMKLIPQLDFAYFQPTWKPEQLDVYAQTAGEFIQRYRDDPRILAWSVREEVPHAAVNDLARYYARIREHAPGARFNLVHNQLDAARDQPPPHAAIFGTDRYAFWFEVSGGGYLASPSFALDWTRREATRYYDEAARRDADFMLVVTQGGLLMPQWANQIVADPHGAGIPGNADEQQKVRERVLRFAKERRMGWRTVATPDGAHRYIFWKYYRLPPNCVKALAWTSVLEGAKLFFIWHYGPPAKADLELSIDAAATQPSPRYEFNWITLAGRPGVANPQLAELAEASREIRRYEGLIVPMRKVADSPILCAQPGVYHRAFALKEIEGRLVVLHNANVGRWPHDSRHFFNVDDDIRIDGEGNLVDYVPFKEPLEVQFTVDGRAAGPSPMPTVFDAATAQPVPRDASGRYRVSIAPGSGTLVYVGSEEGARLMKARVK